MGRGLPVGQLGRYRSWKASTPIPGEPHAGVSPGPTSGTKSHFGGLDDPRRDSSDRLRSCGKVAGARSGRRRGAPLPPCGRLVSRAHRGGAAGRRSPHARMPGRSCVSRRHAYGDRTTGPAPALRQARAGPEREGKALRRRPLPASSGQRQWWANSNHSPGARMAPNSRPGIVSPRALADLLGKTP
jgi:hypothetical protein